MARKPRRQSEIPGTERESNGAIDEVAAEYVEALYGAKDMQAKAVALKPALREVLAANGYDNELPYVYQDDDYQYTLALGGDIPKLRCKRRSLSEIAGEDDE